jgi:hypothetical protein
MLSYLGCVACNDSALSKEVQVVTANNCDVEAPVLADAEAPVLADKGLKVQEALRSVSVAEDGIFTVDLTRSFLGEPLGVALVCKEEVVKVTTLDSGALIGLYNNSVDEGRQVRPGDVVARVNGSSHFESIQRSLQRDMEVRLELQRGAEQEPAAEPDGDICVVLSRAGVDTTLGLHVAPLKNMARVVRVNSEGALATHNWMSEKEQQVRRHDLLLSVNGHRDLEAMGRSLQQDLELSLELLRPTELTVTVERCGQPLGLSLTTLVDSFSLVVASVHGGATQEYNQTCAEELQLGVGDVIIGVNGSTGRSAELLDIAQSADTVQFTVLRHPALA